MPEFRRASEITIDTRGDGWTVTTLADGKEMDGLAMSARLWHVDAGASGPEQEWREPRERFLFVISGDGVLELASGATPIGREDMVWIEPGDRFRLRAGRAQPLVVLDAAST